MTICCRIGDRRIHHRLRHMEASTESGLTTRQLRIPGDGFKRSFRADFSKRTGTGDQQSFCLLAEPPSALPRSGLVSFSFDSFRPGRPPTLAAKLPPRAGFWLGGPTIAGSLQGSISLSQLIPPAWSMQCHTCVACCQTVRLYSTVQRAIQTTRSQCLTG